MARRSRRGSSRVHSWRDVFTLAVLDTREHEEQPLAHSTSFSVEQTDGPSVTCGHPEQHRDAGGTAALIPQPLFNGCTVPSRAALPAPLGLRTEGKQQHSGTAEAHTSHQSNSSTTNITVLKGTTPPCSVPMLYANLHSLRPVQVHDSH